MTSNDFHHVSLLPNHTPKALEVKNRELSMALASFSEFQTKAEQRENEIRKNTAKDDDRVQALEEQKVLWLGS